MFFLCVSTALNLIAPQCPSATLLSLRDLLLFYIVRDATASTYYAMYILFNCSIFI